VQKRSMEAAWIADMMAGIATTLKAFAAARLP
jgi:hypothetical protein